MLGFDPDWAVIIDIGSSGSLCSGFTVAARSLDEASHLLLTALERFEISW